MPELRKMNDCHDGATGEFCSDPSNEAASAGANTQEMMNRKNPTIPYATDMTKKELTDKTNGGYLAGPNVSEENKQQCVSLAHALFPDLPPAKLWTPGEQVTATNVKDIPPGTLIATFVDGHYLSRSGSSHAAIFYGHHMIDGVTYVDVVDQYPGAGVAPRSYQIDPLPAKSLSRIPFFVVQK